MNDALKEILSQEKAKSQINHRENEAATSNNNKETLLTPALIILLWALQIDSNNNNILSAVSSKHVPLDKEKNLTSWEDRGIIVLPRSSKEHHIDELSLLIDLSRSSELTCDNSIIPSFDEDDEIKNKKKETKWLDEEQFQHFSDNMQFSIWYEKQLLS